MAVFRCTYNKHNHPTPFSRSCPPTGAPASQNTPWRTQTRVYCARTCEQSARTAFMQLPNY